MQNQTSSNKSENTKAPGTAKSPDLSDVKPVRTAVTIGREPQEVFSFFREFSNLPYFMKDVTSIEVTSLNTSHWVIDLPRGPKIEWDAEIISEKQGEMISWKSIGETPVEQAGSVWFKRASGGRGTVVSLSLAYKLAGGKLTELATKILAEDPETLALKNLRRLKAYMETGEVPTTEGQPSGREDESKEIKGELQ